MKKKLSICIPTYNRADKIESLLYFLYQDIDGIMDDRFEIEIIIGDNNSDDLTKEVAINSDLSRLALLTYNKNSENLGLIGNLLNLANLATGDYVWFMGDDDVYHQGILSAAKKSILEDNYAYIFINHCAYIQDKKDTSGFKSAVDINKKSIYDDAQHMILDIWRTSETSLMFISASIFKNEILKDCLKTSKTIDLAYPLYMSFYCGAKGKAKVIKEIYIDDILGEATWTKFKEDVFLNYVPAILKCLPEIGYNSRESKDIYNQYKKSKFKAYSKYRIKRFFKLTSK